jgi:hypothetical protein
MLPSWRAAPGAAVVAGLRCRCRWAESWEEEVEVPQQAEAGEEKAAAATTADAAAAGVV